jgi:hypothetical protein
MDAQSTILLAAKPGWVSGIFREILAAHGFKVLLEQCGFTPVVIGHAFPGTIDLLLAEVDYKGAGSGKALAENLGALRPLMQCLFFEVRNGRILMGTDPESGFENEFSPASFLKEVTELSTYGFYPVG